MAEMLYFDRQDRELLKMINDIIDNGPSSDLEHKILKPASIRTAYSTSPPRTSIAWRRLSSTFLAV